MFLHRRVVAIAHAQQSHYRIRGVAKTWFRVPTFGGIHFVFASHAAWRFDFSLFQPLSAKTLDFRFSPTRAGGGPAAWSAATRAQFCIVEPPRGRATRRPHAMLTGSCAGWTLCIFDVVGSWAGGGFTRRGVACQSSARYG